MLHTIWILSAIILIFFIILHNPKSQGISGQNQLFVSTRSSEANLNKFTWLLIGIFFSLATYMAILNNALFLDPSPKPSRANLFKHGGPSLNISSTFSSLISIFSTSSLLQA